jgi:hypothetical protein
MLGPVLQGLNFEKRPAPKTFSQNKQLPEMRMFECRFFFWMVMPASENVKESLDRRRACFETAASRPLQHEVFSLCHKDSSSS